MDRTQKEALQVTKEIVVKFIETQRISPSNFGDIFPSIYSVVRDTITADQAPVGPVGTDNSTEKDA